MRMQASDRVLSGKERILSTHETNWWGLEDQKGCSNGMSSSSRKSLGLPMACSIILDSRKTMEVTVWAVSVLCQVEEFEG